MIAKVCEAVCYTPTFKCFMFLDMLLDNTVKVTSFDRTAFNYSAVQPTFDI